jgi:flagellar protein FliS
MNTYFNQYKQNQTKTASPEQILIMLYDGAIRFTRQAIEGVENAKPAQKLEGISRAMAIIVEFSSSLDRNIGGQIAEDLDALYFFMTRQLTEARKDNDVEKLRVVEGLLVDLRETWMQAVEIKRKEEAGTQAQAAPEGRKTLIAAG